MSVIMEILVHTILSSRLLSSYLKIKIKTIILPVMLVVKHGLLH